MSEGVIVAQWCLILCNAMDLRLPGSSVHGILQARILVGSHSLLHGIFLTQGSNTGLLHCRQILYRLNHQGSLCKSPCIYGAHAMVLRLSRLESSENLVKGLMSGTHLQLFGFSSSGVRSGYYLLFTTSLVF